LLSLNKRL